MATTDEKQTTTSVTLDTTNIQLQTSATQMNNNTLAFDSTVTKSTTIEG